MPVIAVVALMGFLFLPGSAGAPAYAETVSAPIAASEQAEEPAKRLATSLEAAQTYSVRMTAYNAVPEQTDSNPFVTASGMASNPEVVVARSRDLAAELPFGTVIRIERAKADTHGCQFSRVEHQIGYRIVADTMHQRWVKKIDVLFDQNNTVSVGGRELNPAIAVGLCDDVSITVVGKVDMKNPPTTQAELVAMFSAPTLARR